MRLRALLLGAAAALVAVAAQAHEKPAWPANWTQPTEPFHLADNLYYVGSAGLSAWLLTTPKGHILIDAPMAENVPAIEANIRKLGFRVEDVKILLNSHAHFDHAAGLAAIKRDSGAQLAAAAGDVQQLQTGTYVGVETRADLKFPPVKVDRVLKDGDTVSLGGVTLTARVTAGHSPGCTTWAFPLKVDGRTRQALYYCSTSVALNRLAPKPQYPGIVDDYRKTFRTLEATKADVFLAPHAEQFDLAEKRARLKPGRPNPFVDPTELQRIVAESKADFEAACAKQGCK
ncbi:subclass B3 metallo-beta-lactamase [Caulobacter mirabilis]|uniref:Subclass B3 metallo-beta-lactamase n=1 Tax=Caulobacter mirabilis TaxID=69666 RepID=A0A2D2AW42_9CAUL|nr:subclass B3 metallo-beta-lactamase [Caulobacter mirabilis]ATQ42191.1 subclass B3 metallo-beta-lactamase [Caulobacter mirabilis]